MRNPYIDQLKTYLYILQSAEYNIGSFLKWFKENKGKKIEKQKKKLVWTAKAKIIFILTLILWGGGLLSLTIYLFLILKWYLALIIAAIITLIWQILLVFFLIIPTILLRPFEKIYLHFYLNKAKKKLLSFKKKNDGLKVIGITGSYGKTSVKECLVAILKEKYNVLSTPENINTPIGVARLILNNLTENHEIFIVEMGAYMRGDIKRICDLVYPQIGILTGINEQHQERFKTIENTIKTKFELIESLPKEGLGLINGDNKYCLEQILEAPKKITKPIKCKIKLYFTKNLDKIEPKEISGVELVPVRLVNYQQLENTSKFVIIKKNIKTEFEVKLLGKHNILNILPGILLGETLSLNDKQIKEGIKNIKPISHRLKPIMSKNNILIIDDAYNGNPDGVTAAIEVLRNFDKRRKIFVTPGLVELGKSRGEVHKKIGMQLTEVADLVLLIQNSNTKFFLQGLKERNYPENKIKIYESSQKMQDDLKNILQTNDVVLFQNDWPDNYL